jgi:hypothetical protein
MALILFIVIYWSVAYGIEQTKEQWRLACYERARELRVQHPDWGRAKARKRAKFQTATWWAREVIEGFPTMRQAWAEDIASISHLRATAAITRESRLADVRMELQSLREAREAHRLAIEDKTTELEFGPWYQQWQAGAGLPSRPEPGDDTPAPQGPLPPLPSREADTPPATVTSPGDDEPPTQAGHFPDLPADDLVDPPRVPVIPGPSAREANPITENAGDEMSDIPSGELSGDSPYQAAQTALNGYERVAQENEQAAETLEAQLAMHGFDRDHDLMDHVRGLRESAGQIRAHAAQARQVLTDHHAMGAEYHQSGADANASAFRA